MKILQEVTDWGSSAHTNHVYHVLSNGKLYAYQPQGGELKIFKNPLTFDRGGRKFVTVSTGPDPETQGCTVQVPGSSGNTYTVTLGHTNTCDCSGFRYRGHCKHIQIAQEKVT